MLKNVVFDSNIYTHRQVLSLMRDLTAQGWRVALIAGVDARPPSERMSPNRWVCQVNEGGPFGPGGSRIGDSAWDCVSRAVAEIVNLEAAE